MPENKSPGTISATQKNLKIDQIFQFCAKKWSDSIQTASGPSKSIDSNVLTALGASRDGFPGAKMIPRASHRRPKMLKTRAIAQILILLDDFLAIFVLMQSHDPFLNHFYTDFRTFSNVFLVIFWNEIKNRKHAFGLVFYDIISRWGKSKKH